MGRKSRYGPRPARSQLRLRGRLLPRREPVPHGSELSRRAVQVLEDRVGKILDQRNVLGCHVDLAVVSAEVSNLPQLLRCLSERARNSSLLPKVVEFLEQVLL